MALLKIHTYGSVVLRKKAEPIKEIEEKHLMLAIDMLETMYDASGLGLAAPQIGKSVRLIVVDVSPMTENKNPEPIILFNPEIIKSSDEYQYQEGCLSFPNIFVNVTRPAKITVSAVNEKKEKIILENIDGMLARCILHEIDHLDGVLFIDKISPADRLLIKNKLKKLSKQ